MSSDRTLIRSFCFSSSPTAEMASNSIAFREIDQLVVIGKQEPELVFEFLGRKRLQPRDHKPARIEPLLDRAKTGASATSQGCR